MNQQSNFLINANKTGSTLLEVVVVCALFVTLATLCIGAYRFFHRFAAQIELEQLYMACRYMQRRAMCTHQEQHLVFNLQERRYQYANRSHTLMNGVEFGVINGVQGPPAHPTHAVIKPITFPNNTIIFYPSGIISSGSVYITDNAHSCCYALSNGVSSISLLRRYVYRRTWQLI